MSLTLGVEARNVLSSGNVASETRRSGKNDTDSEEIHVALFKKKPPVDGEANNKSENNEQFTPQPERARQFFDRAKQVAMKTNYAYAINLYAEGLKLDPESMSAHEAIKDAGIRYHSQG